METIKKIIANLSKVDLGLVIAGFIISIGIVIALIVFAVKQWEWLVGIGVPSAVAATIIAYIVTKIKKALAG